MEYKFSDRVLTLKPSAIREIFKYAADPSYVSLSAGNPAPEAFPSKQLAAISAKLMEEEPILALQYSTTEGYPPLLQHLKAYMKSSKNIGTEDDGVLVTSGAQQIMDLFTKSILNEGETVLCEAPSFIGSLNDFRSYEGEPLPSIKSFDTDGIVLYAGSFSKVISPGMRVGYAIGPKPVLAKMTVCKQGQDVHTNIWSQVLCYRFMTEYDFDAHLAGLRKIYTKKRALLLDLMEKHLAPYITWDPFNGGLFAWCHLPKGVDMMEFVQKALEKKVCVVPGTAFLTDENEPCDAFRINFSTPTDEQLTKGITLLGETIREMAEK